MCVCVNIYSCQLPFVMMILSYNLALSENAVTALRSSVSCVFCHCSDV